MKIFVAGLSYKTAPVALREKIAIHPTHLRRCGREIKAKTALSEVVVLSTCNRVEIYGVTGEDQESPANVFQHLSDSDIDFERYIYVKQGAAALEHLFAVSAGLDSMVIGETEINGQVKLAYQAAQTAKLTGKVLNRVFQQAFRVAKKIRTGTGIGRGAVSIGSVAVELAEKIFDRDLPGKTVMIIGAGKMGEVCLKHLSKRGAKSVLVSNRSFERAQMLASEFHGRAIRFCDCLKAMAEADIVISSTGSPDTILNRKEIAQVMAARPHQPLVLIDIAVPRDIAVDAHKVSNVYLFDVDDLELIVREHVRCRRQEISDCQAIIAAGALELTARFESSTESAITIDPEPAWAL